MFEIGRRIKEARESLGLTQKQVAEKVGMTQQGYQDIEKGGVKQPRNIEKLAHVLKKPKEYLLFGTPIYGTPTGEKTKNKIPIISWQLVNTLDRMDAAKFTNTEEYVLNFNKFNDNCFALRVQGDSMQNAGRKSFNEGDLIIVDPDKKATPGHYVIYSEKGTNVSSFKQYVVDGNQAILKPLNPQYPILPLNNNIKIKGVVVAHVDVLL